MQHRFLGTPAGQVWPVVVVGAGPAGLVAATSLARSGIRVLLVAKAAPSTHPKATVRGPINPGQGAQLEWADLREVE